MHYTYITKTNQPPTKICICTVLSAFFIISFLNLVLHHGCICIRKTIPYMCFSSKVEQTSLKCNKMSQEQHQYFKTPNRYFKTLFFHKPKTPKGEGRLVFTPIPNTFETKVYSETSQPHIVIQFLIGCIQIIAFSFIRNGVLQLKTISQINIKLELKDYQSERRLLNQRCNNYRYLILHPEYQSENNTNS